jgi:hypothetical protein
LYIKYQKSTAFSSGEITNRAIKPFLIEKIGITESPCVKGYCYLRNEDRVFAIERTEILEISNLSYDLWSLLKDGKSISNSDANIALRNNKPPTIKKETNLLPLKIGDVLYYNYKFTLPPPSSIKNYWGNILKLNNEEYEGKLRLIIKDITNTTVSFSTINQYGKINEILSEISNETIRHYIISGQFKISSSYLGSNEMNRIKHFISTFKSGTHFYIAPDRSLVYKIISIDNGIINIITDTPSFAASSHSYLLSDVVDTFGSKRWEIVKVKKSTPIDKKILKGKTSKADKSKTKESNAKESKTNQPKGEILTKSNLKSKNKKYKKPIKKSWLKRLFGL